MREFEGGATRDTNKGKLQIAGYFSPIVIERYSQFMRSHQIQGDGTHRAADNWTLGIPESVYIDSLDRHVLDAKLRFQFGVAIDGAGPEETYQDVLCAIIFNAMGLLFEDLMNDKERRLARPRSLYSKE